MAPRLRVSNVWLNAAESAGLSHRGDNVARIVGNSASLPIGTTANRPTGESGLIRFNSDYTKFESYNGSAWSNVVTGIVDLGAANSWANGVGTSANAYTVVVGTAGNAYAVAVGTAGNAYATAIGTAGNAYAVAVGTAGNAYASVVGTTGNSYANTITFRASVSEYRANSNTNLLTVANTWAAMSEVTLTDASTIAWDMSTGIDFVVTLGANRTLGNPSNATVGKKGRLRVVQDGTGSRTLAFDTLYKFSNGDDPVLTTTASAVDILYYDVVTTSFIVISMLRDVK
jgi:hypothetical protein